MTAKLVFLALLAVSLGVEAQTPPAQATTNSPPRWDTVAPPADTNGTQLRPALQGQPADPTNTSARPRRSKTARPSDPFSPEVTRAAEEDSSSAPSNPQTTKPSVTQTDAQAKADAERVEAARAAARAAATPNPAGPPTAVVPAGAPASQTPTPPVAGALAPGAVPPGAVPPGAIPPPPAVPTNLPAPLTPNEPVAIKPGASAANPPDETPQMTIQLQAADINQVLETYADLVDRTVLRPATLPAPTITLKTHGQLTRKEAKEALDVVLGLNGISMIDMGDKFVKAVPVAQAGQEGNEWTKLAADQLPLMGQYVTYVLQLKYAKPSELVQVLQPFAKIPNAIIPIDSSMVLVLRDFTENVKRMLEMVAKIDVIVPSDFEEEVIPIKYALASDIASALNSLSSGGGGTTVGSGAGGGRGGGAGRTGSSMFNRQGTQPGGYPGGTGVGTSPFGGINPQGTTSTTAGGTGPSFTQRLQNIINRASGSGSGEFQILGQTKIIADERTNSLLIFANHEDMKMIKNIVSKLDIVLAQVLIEAVVIQVSLNDSRNLGVSYLQHPQTSGNWNFAGAINNSTFLSSNAFGAIAASGTNAVSGIPSGFSYLASLNNDLDIALTAVASDSHAKVLQRPRIQTSNAKMASLFVGESRPYPVSSYYGGASFGGYASIQQLQIGVTLEITPLINVEGLVVMDIHQKIDSFEGNVTIQGVGDVPVTSSKEAQASVAVRDHDTIMLGGLIETDKNNNNSGVPFLKDLPLVGVLFRASTKSENRNEFIVLIRPTVLPTPEVAALVAQKEKEGMPGARLTEQEIRAEEALRIRDGEKKFRQFQRDHPGLLPDK